jgi:two-component system nitrate/nitrite response regulator NarL
VSASASKRRIRVYLADDHPVYLRGLARAIEQRAELRLIGNANDGRQALEDITREAPDVALIDLRMPGLDGMQILAAAKRDGIATRIIVLSGHADSKAIYDAVANGAAGYLSKLSDVDAICDSIVAAQRGEIALCQEFQMALADEIQRREVKERPLLTAREMEILRLIADGLSAPEIGRQIHLSTATVKTHLHAVYEKLGVSDRASAVAVAMRQGLLE